MKIDEPKTPFVREEDIEEDEEYNQYFGKNAIADIVSENQPS